jgi:hypothetical protein
MSVRASIALVAVAGAVVWFAWTTCLTGASSSIREREVSGGQSEYRTDCVSPPVRGEGKTEDASRPGRSRLLSSLRLSSLSGLPSGWPLADLLFDMGLRSGRLSSVFALLAQVACQVAGQRRAL